MESACTVETIRVFHTRFAPSVIRRFENAFNGVTITQRFVKKVKEAKPVQPPAAPPPPPLPQLKVASVRPAGTSAAVPLAQGSSSMQSMQSMQSIQPMQPTPPIQPIQPIQPTQPTQPTATTPSLPMIPMQIKPINPYETDITADNAPGGVFSDCYRAQREQNVPRYTPIPEAALRRDMRPLSPEMKQEFEKTIDLLLKRVKTNTLADGMEERIQRVEEINEFIPRGELVFPKS